MLSSTVGACYSQRCTDRYDAEQASGIGPAVQRRRGTQMRSVMLDQDLPRVPPSLQGLLIQHGITGLARSCALRGRPRDGCASARSLPPLPPPSPGAGGASWTPGPHSLSAAAAAAASAAPRIPVARSTCVARVLQRPPPLAAASGQPGSDALPREPHACSPPPARPQRRGAACACP